MTEDLDALLDECIDRINRGQSLEECLASYPEHAEQLEPLLRTILDIHAACSPIPSLAAKAAAKSRLDAASAEMGKRQKLRGVPAPLFRRPMVWAVAIVLSLLAVIDVALCALMPGGTPAPAFAQANFRLLISDEANAIGDFQSLNVTITSIGVHGGPWGGPIEIELDPAVTVDLVPLQGTNAMEIWNGTLPPGHYTKVFIYIGEVNGTLKNNTTANVFVPSGKLQIPESFNITITADGFIVNFVFDITVVKAGESGRYNLLPQIAQSGPGKPFYAVGEGDLTIQLVEGNATPGAAVTVLVTLHGTPVANASVTVSGEEVGTTNETGYISFVVPYVDEWEIKAVLGELEGELEIEL
jgi:hypothetical protein